MRGKAPQKRLWSPQAGSLATPDYTDTSVQSFSGRARPHHSSTTPPSVFLRALESPTTPARPLGIVACALLVTIRSAHFVRLLSFPAVVPSLEKPRGSSGKLHTLAQTKKRVRSSLSSFLHFQPGVVGLRPTAGLANLYTG